MGKKNYFLKIYRYPDIEKIKTEIALLNKLGYRAFFFEDGDKKGVITEYLNGSEPKQTEKNLFKIGAQISKLHLVQTDGLETKNQKQKFIKLEKEIKDQGLKFLYPLLENCKNIPFDRLPVSLIHGDVFLDNTIEKDGKITLVDYEEIAYSNSLFDVARAVIGCCITKGEIEKTLTDALIKGYETNRSLEDIEKNHFKKMIIYTGLYSVFWRYREFNILRPDSGKKDLYRELLKPIVSFSGS